MKNCNPCNKPKDPCVTPCVTKLLIDECTGAKISYITLASAVLMECNDPEGKTLVDALREIWEKLYLIDLTIEDLSDWEAFVRKIAVALQLNNLELLEPALTNVINNIVNDKFDELKLIFIDLFTSWKNAIDELLEQFTNNNITEIVESILASKNFVKALRVNGGDVIYPNSEGIADFTININLDSIISRLTTIENKLDGIENGALKNVQSNWLQSDQSSDDYIKNKPIVPDEAIISRWGFTKNAGTVTAVKFNGGSPISPDNQGVVDLGNIGEQYPNAIHVFQELPNQLDIEQIYVKCYSVYQYNFLKYHIDDKTDPDDLGMVTSVLLGLYLDSLNQRTTLDNASFGLVPVSILQSNWNTIDPDHVINYSLVTINDVAYYKLPIIPRTILLIRETQSRGETLDVSLVNRCLNELLGKSFTGFNIMEIKNVIYVDENGVQHNIALKDDNTYYDAEHGCYVHVYSENGSLYIKFISQPINVPEEAIMDTMDLNDIDYLYSLGMQVYLVHKFSDISNVKIHLNARNSSSVYGTTLLGSYLFHAEVNSNGVVVRKYTVDDVEDCETGDSCTPVPDPTVA